jgi:hypothetical protein
MSPTEIKDMALRELRGGTSEGLSDDLTIVVLQHTDAAKP